MKPQHLRHLFFLCAREDFDSASRLMNGMAAHEPGFFPFALEEVREAVSFYDNLYPLEAPEKVAWHCILSPTFNHEKFARFLDSVAWKHPDLIRIVAQEETGFFLLSIGEYGNAASSTALEAISWKSIAEQHILKSNHLERKVVKALSLIEDNKDWPEQDAGPLLADLEKALTE